MRAMKLRLISFGHTASHDPVTVQLPKPSLSICATILATRRSFSTLPCGNSPRCETLADTNNIADAFLHAATHAPQPMHAAASIDRSLSTFAIARDLAARRPAVVLE